MTSIYNKVIVEVHDEEEEDKKLSNNNNNAVRRPKVGDPGFEQPDGGWGWWIVFACGFSNVGTKTFYIQFPFRVDLHTTVKPHRRSVSLVPKNMFTYKLDDVIHTQYVRTLNE